MPTTRGQSTLRVLAWSLDGAPMRILFVCKDHGTRSRMAAHLARQALGHEHQIESVGLTSGILNPASVQALKEMGDAQPGPSRALKDIRLSDYSLAVVVGMERDLIQALPQNLKRLT